ncbi:MAG: hypothetical protein KF912_11685 [Phycisphaeraceae bacterium]|nr:hypothetical protein [Phycisphaeraceae bacterium]MBX3367962.1 hypothetical protein [Phycisphaeraceae bacterium]
MSFFQKRDAALEIQEVYSLDYLSLLRIVSADSLPLTWNLSSGLEPPRHIPLRHLRSTVVRFRNTGDVPFDWERLVREPITLRIGRDAEILQARVIHKSNNDVYVTTELSPTGSDVIVSTDFLNAKREFMLEVMHTSPSNTLSVTGRVVGQGDLKLLEKTDSIKTTVATRPFLLALFSSVHGMLIVVFVAMLDEASLRKVASRRYRICTIVVCVAICMVISLFAVYVSPSIMPARYDSSWQAQLWLYSLIATDIAVLSLVWYGARRVIDSGKNRQPHSA